MSLPGLLETLRAFWARSFRRRLAISLAVFAAATVLTLVLFSAVRQREFLLRESERTGIALAEALAISSRSSVLTNDLASLAEMVGSLRSYPDVRYVMVIAPRGKVIAHSDSAPVGRYLGDAVSQSLLSGPPATRILADDEALLDVAAPIQVQGTQVGWARIGLGRQWLATGLSGIATAGTWFTLAVIAMAIVLALLFTRSLTREFERLVQVARDRAKGTLDRGEHRIGHFGSDREDELGVLANAFDRMTAALGAALNDAQLSLAQVSDLYDNAPCGYHSLGPDGTFLRINETELAWFGYEREELVGKMRFQDLLVAESRALFEERFPELQLLGYVHDLEFEFRRKDGSRLHLILNAQAVYDEAGKFTNSRSTLHDVTERKLAEQEVRRLNAELESRVQDRTARLEAANQDLEAFSYSISHDLRAPLRVIDGYAQLLQEEEGAGISGQGLRWLDSIRSSAGRMADLIRDLLEFSRSSQREINRDRIDMNALVLDVMDEIRAFHPERFIGLQVKDLPPASASRPLMRQVLVNLLSNAVKFTAGKDQAMIVVGATATAGETVYRVQDNGVGFDMKHADGLFGVFHRLRGSEKIEGTGIGLAIVKRIVQRHGGRVWAEGQPGVGAVLSFSLPVDTALA